MPYSWLSEALGLTQMVMDIWKQLKSTYFIIPNNFCFNNFSKKSIPGDARAQVLQEPVGGSHADQGRKSGGAPMFLGPGGQEEPDGTPHLTQGSPPDRKTSENPALISVGGANRFLEDLSPDIPRD